MDRDILSHLPVVMAVARRGGFAAAAKELGMSPSAVSHAVKLVEERLAVPLFARTTRSVALTEAGRALVDGAGPALREIDERIEVLRAARGQVGGLLRINVPSVALPLVVTPVVSAMSNRYPDVRVEIFLDNGLTDIVAGGFDAGVRHSDQIAEDMVAVTLTPPLRVLIVGSPAYLAAHGTPRSLADLARHNCIAYRLVRSGGLYRWKVAEEGRGTAIDSPGSVIVNDVLYARELARAGIGLAYLYEPLVAADLASGALVEILPEAAAVDCGFSLYFPHRAVIAPKLRAYVDTAREVLTP